jgi:small-conductance mechanosensitive channel
MTPQIPLFNLLSDIAGGMREPGLIRQIGALMVCIVLGWALASSVRAALVARRVLASTVSVGAQNVVGVLSPLLIVLLLALARSLLEPVQRVHLLSVALPLFGSLAIVRSGFYLLRRVFARHGHTSVIMLTFEKIFASLVWLAVALYIIGWWPALFLYLDNTVLPLGHNKVSIAVILQAAVSVALLLILALWAGAALEERLMKVDGLHSSLRVVMARMARAVLILISLLVSLSLVGIDLTVLSVFGGALGVGLGFGLQKITSNYVSGFIILLDRSLSIGDMISVDKYAGKVMHINTRYTVLRGLDGVESVVPNEMLVSGAVQNYSLSDKMMRLATQVTVGYDTDVDLALALLESAAAGIDRVSSEPPPMAMLQRFGADGLELEVGFWISDPENGRGGVASDVNRAIWRTLQAHRISVPYPQREVRMLGPGSPQPTSGESETG